MKITKPPEPSEYEQHKSIFVWAKVMEREYPELALLNSSANGAWFPGALGELKYKILAVLKATGCIRPGFPDINLPVSRGGWHALYIELKKKTGKPSPEQILWVEALRLQGNLACFCFGQAMAEKVIVAYLKGAMRRE